MNTEDAFCKRCREVGAVDGCLLCETFRTTTAKPREPNCECESCVDYGNLRYGRKIVDVCESLHGSISGVSDPLPLDRQRAMVKWLRMRLDDWRHGHANWKEYDDAMRALVEATLREINRDWTRSPGDE